MPLNEPAEGKRKSQIEEYLETYGGPGVQHSPSHRDIVTSVEALRPAGSSSSTARDLLRRVPGALGEIAEAEDLQRLGILVDHDDEGYLLQIFTEPISDRPTVFFEIIQRHGARGFGEGNFKALFEAIERSRPGVETCKAGQTVGGGTLGSRYWGAGHSRGTPSCRPTGCARALGVVPRRRHPGEARAALDAVLGEDVPAAVDGLISAQAAWLGPDYSPGPALSLDTGPLDADRVNAWSKQKTHGMIPRDRGLVHR